MTALSVNINKIAVLRNSRGGVGPDPIDAAQACIQAGCDGITVHPRPDGRHILHHDVINLRSLCLGEGGGRRVEFNIEGNPFAPPRSGYLGLLALARETRPEQVTLVPDGDGQLTSDHGFDPAHDAERLSPVVAQLKRYGCRVSVFMNAGATELERLTKIGVDRIELYTGPFAHAHEAGAGRHAASACATTAEAAQSAGLGVNAGHDLSQANLGDFLACVPRVLEVSIGHALIGEALYEGLTETVKRYLSIIQRCAAPNKIGNG